jgi:hypothetical protein
MNTDIVKRAINTRRSGSGPSGGSDASVVEPVGDLSSSGEAAGNQDSLSKSMTLTEKAALILEIVAASDGVLRAHVGSKSTSDQRASGLRS